MHTIRTVLRIGKADGTELDIPLRYNASHQRGYRCYIGPLADAPEQITEETERSFEGRRLFDALAEYRKTIEPEGWHLLHAVARRDCWARPDELDPCVRRLTLGVEQTEPINGFDAAEFGKTATLAEQQASFERWMNSLAPVYAPRVPRKAGQEHDPPGVEFSGLARLAGELLVDGKPNMERLLGKR